MPAAVATLIDTGPLVAILNRRDPHHAVCNELFHQVPAPLFTCWPVITETAYLIGEATPAASKLFDLLRSYALALLPLDDVDLDPIQRILTKYADQEFQLADACLMYLAERERVSQVLTLDRNDFSLFRTTAGKALTLFPE